jgi:hypothetical protein
MIYSQFGTAYDLLNKYADSDPKKIQLFFVESIALSSTQAYPDFYLNMYEVEPSHLKREITYECLWKGIEQVRPGNTVGDIGYAIQRHTTRWF